MRSSTKDINNKIDTIDIDFVIQQEVNKIIDGIEENVDIITFCEDPYYLNQPLHPVERIILKVYYGVPLNDVDPLIQCRGFPHNPKGMWFTEKQYIEFLIKQNRINVDCIEDLQGSQELVLVCGRRSGKTFLASTISSYEIYKLITKYDPQKHYKLPRGEQIKFICVATTSDQALILATAVKNRILNSQWFERYVESTTQSAIRFRTKADLDRLSEDIEKYGEARDRYASVVFESMSCTARGVRGGTVMVAVLDEIAHFEDNSGNRSGDKVYEAISPSVATFGLDGKIVCISSPYTKSGVFYDIYQDSFKNKRMRRMFQIPTWEMNEQISFEYLLSEKGRHAESFEWEFGAEFQSVVSAFFTYPEKIDECTLIEIGDLPKFSYANHKYVIAIDPSAGGHGYAMCMLHYEVDNEGINKIVLDRWMLFDKNDPRFSTEGIIGVDIEKVEEYILSLTKAFNVVKVVYDQFDSTASIQKLKKRGINAEKTPFTIPYIMKIYKALKKSVYENKIKLINYDYAIKELKCLQQVKKQKKTFVVTASDNSEVTTDDLADVIANATYVITQMINKNDFKTLSSNSKRGHQGDSQKHGRAHYQQKQNMHQSVDKMKLINSTQRRLVSQRAMSGSGGRRGY